MKKCLLYKNGTPVFQDSHDHVVSTFVGKSLVLLYFDVYEYESRSRDLEDIHIPTVEL